MLKIKNKKAQAGELIQDTVALIFIVLLLTTFFLLSGTAWKGLKTNVEQISFENSVSNQEHYSLYAWLQKPVEIQMENEKQIISIAELIMLSQSDPQYKEILDSEKSRAFDSAYEYDFKIKSFSEEHSETSGYSRFYLPDETVVLLHIKKLKS